MKRGAPLKRKTPLRAKRWGIAPKRDPEKRARQEAFRQAVTLNAQGLCQFRTTDCPEYPHPGVVCHHILPRSAGGSDDPSNGAYLCAAAHRFVHAMPMLSYEFGWLKKRGADAAAPR